MAGVGGADAPDKADGGPVEVTRHEHAAPPTLDEDGAAIRAWLGLPSSAKVGP